VIAESIPRSADAPGLPSHFHRGGPRAEYGVFLPQRSETRLAVGTALEVIFLLKNGYLLNIYISL